MLTSQDLKKISQLMKSSEERILTTVNKSIKSSEEKIINFMEERVEAKLISLTEQMLDYTNTIYDSHDKKLKNHESRIKKLETQKTN